MWSLPSIALIIVLLWLKVEAFVSRIQSRSYPSTRLFIASSEDLRHTTLREALLKLEQVHHDAAPFFRKLNKAVEVRPSLIPGAGQGLFARKNIKAGSIVSFYPVHGLGFEGDESSTCVATNDVNEAFFNQELSGSNAAAANYVQFLIGSRPLLSHNVKDVFGDDALFANVNPSQADDIGWLSHYINDGATVEGSGDEQSILDYYASSRASKNCASVPFGPCPILATVATRKVKKGEELLTTYGGSFWFDVISPDAELEATEAIQQEAMETAKDIYKFMQSIRVTYVKEAATLHSSFSTE